LLQAESKLRTVANTNIFFIMLYGCFSLNL